MTGKELFEYYTSKRDYSGSDEDKYAQTLMTIWAHIFDETYPLLEEAERLNKKLDVRVFPDEELFLHDEIIKEDIVYV